MPPPPDFVPPDPAVGLLPAVPGVPDVPLSEEPSSSSPQALTDASKANVKLKPSPRAEILPNRHRVMGSEVCMALKFLSRKRFDATQDKPDERSRAGHRTLKR